VALAAHDRRGPHHPSRRTRRRRDRLQRHFRGAGPNVAKHRRASFRNLDDNIRDKLRNLPSNDEVLAQAIRRARDKLNQEFKREADQNGGKYMPLNVGIGLNTGPCVVGNMGSDFRFNYSVLGDTVNVASRLEARTKDYRVPIVIGAQTAS